MVSGTAPAYHRLWASRRASGPNPWLWPALPTGQSLLQALDDRLLPDDDFDQDLPVGGPEVSLSIHATHIDITDTAHASICHPFRSIQHPSLNSYHSFARAQVVCTRVVPFPPILPLRLNVNVSNHGFIQLLKVHVFRQGQMAGKNAAVQRNSPVILPCAATGFETPALVMNAHIDVRSFEPPTFGWRVVHHSRYDQSVRDFWYTMLVCNSAARSTPKPAREWGLA